MARPRDSQRQRVYDAEDEAFGDQRVLSLNECQEFVDKVMKRTTTRKIWAELHESNDLALWPLLASSVEVHDGRGRRSGCVRGTALLMPRWTRQKWYLLHELSHVLTPHHHKRKALASHGATFCRVYLALAEAHLNKDGAARLRECMKKRNVRLVGWT